MKLNSLVDPKKREQIREAIRKKDASLLPVSKKPVAQPLVEEKPKQEVNEVEKEAPSPAPQPSSQQQQTKKKGKWSSISDDELMEQVKKIIDEGRIKTQQELAKGNNDLFHALRKRRLVKKAFE